MLMALALLLALVVDSRLGEPPARWHPVVWIGRYLGWAGRLAAPPVGNGATKRVDLPAFVRGTVLWSLGALVVLALSFTLQRGLLATLVKHDAALAPRALAVLILGLALKPLLAWRMLHDEVSAVEQALGQSLPAGRAHLARLVSRDVSALSAEEVRESAIESLAENLNDSVVAPLFWFALFGLPGAALYRYANTADAMWGYTGARDGRHWAWAGKWAARADDVLSWIPARLTGLTLAALSGARCNLPRLRREAARTPSPNSGWPMAAMALALNLRLGKPGVYQLNANAPQPQAPDCQRAQQLARRCVLVTATVLSAVLALWGR